jgi:Ca2+:H+ antiporter
MTEAGTRSPTFVRSDYVVVGGGAVAVVLAGLAHYLGWGDVLTFLLAAAAVTLLASLVGRSVEQLGDRFGSPRSATCLSCSSPCSRCATGWSTWSRRR